ncbi:hypothetical protein F0P96_08855 [Hymenobacter busanensis]|uniref:Uncharacterized protein n=1 Tax=Hymenobacter busanensis TaxID=2607656 RepID=A0A7L4ZZ75_9BACT|nr:hypothetical protein [Hymenobacter busanensis]KAA9333082.1 hypothetical protein F0P96_08855 [Hymenobacter busanensis]QHJ08243.1 hypothetical protein GUY19_13470 [Hymenobacter busanensis]
MRYLFPLLLLLSMLTVLLPGCEPKEEIITTDPSAKLEFSTDTVTFDTVFVQTGTVTKRLWVFNRNKRAVRVEEIRLAAQQGTTYQVTIGGDAGPTARNVEIRGNDSLLVLVKATVQPGTDKPFLVEDQLLFRTNKNDQQVRLIAYGQNAYFHNAEVLPCNAVWRNDKPHVIYNSVLVDSTCTLTIEEGARIYSHAGSAIIVKGTLRVNPALAPTNEVKPDDKRIVRFAGDRLEKFYNDIPGQWSGIQFIASTRNIRTNVLRYCEIKNASFGVLVYNPNDSRPRPKVTVENCVIQNISGQGLTFASGGQSFAGGGVLSFSGDVDVSNTMLTNCGEYAVAGFQGGAYNLQHCTVANYTPQFVRRETASLTFSNALPVDAPTYRVAPSVTMHNSIVWGSIEDELLFVDGNAYAGSVNISNSLLRTKGYNKTGSATTLGLQGNNNLINVDPKFKRTPLNAFDGKFDYRLDTLSAASNKGGAIGLPVLNRDLRNVLRNLATPDLGAYERLNP